MYVSEMWVSSTSIKQHRYVNPQFPAGGETEEVLCVNRKRAKEQRKREVCLPTV